jgi:putative nucleotidyltransferase with HDIG domain
MDAAALSPASGTASGVSITVLMKGIGIETGGDMNPVVQQLLADAEESGSRRLDRRERLVEWLFAAAFLVVAIEMALLLDSERSLAVGPAIALVAAYAIVSRVRFSDGAGYTVPTQLVFVPMLFVLPTALVPLLVATGTLLGNLPDYIRGKTTPDRMVLSLGDSWHAVLPALVLTVAGAETLEPQYWPIYLVALGTQFAGDFVISTTREWIAVGASPKVHIRLLAWVYMVDLLLAPIGLLAGIATDGFPYAFLFVLPLAGLLAIFSRERTARLRHGVELSRAYHGTALLLSDLIEVDHEYTGSHTRSVVSLSLMVASELGMDERDRQKVELGALLHDVGKIAIPNDIINKPGPLTSAEWTIVKTHTVEGQRMLERVGGLLRDIGMVVRSSHERWDGAGYPDRLGGEQIPPAARVVACCDAFNAMTTTRSYRVAMSVPEAVAELRANAGTQFSPAVVAALVRVVQRSHQTSESTASVAA